MLARQIGGVNHFNDRQTKELLEFKKRLGYDDARFHRGEDCDLCGNSAFGRGYAEAQPAAAPAPSRNGHAGGNGHAPDFDRLVQTITDQVLAALAAAGVER